jgi:hypothetical protein
MLALAVAVPSWGYRDGEVDCVATALGPRNLGGEGWAESLCLFLWQGRAPLIHASFYLLAVLPMSPEQTLLPSLVSQASVLSNVS